MNSKDRETVTVELPKNILAFLQACCPNVKQYLEYTIIQGVKGDLDNQDVFTENLIEKYKIE